MWKDPRVVVRLAMVVMTVMALFLTAVKAEVVNVALKKTIEAQYTCGFFEPESYYEHKDVNLSPQDRNLKECNNVTTFPPSNMVDGDNSTIWQSSSREKIYTKGNLATTNPKLEAIIKIDLQQDFLVEKIVLRQGDALRPARIQISRSLDGTTYIPWAYKVTTTSECAGFSSILKAIPESTTDTVCTIYPAQSTTFQTIEFDFTATSSELREWRRVKYLEIKFFEMPMTLSISGVRFQHYTIAELEVMAECACNGQQTGCKQNAETKEYECECGGNTKGQFCEMCMPYYNQKPFKYGTPCEECNCQNHSTTCYYDEATSTNKLSLNASGVKDGGGICVNCEHNTTGVNCEKCKAMFYRPADKKQTDTDACMACNCSTKGSIANPSTSLIADCVMNNDQPLNAGQSPGDCFCKTNVIGKKCDTCKPGFFNLRADNPVGCDACGCNTAGTVGKSTECDVDTGQCPCKENVGNKTCDVCKDGFYNLNENYVGGCTPCGCDPGGSVSLVCDKIRGICKCRPNIEGQKCDKPIKHHYYPEMHFILAEFESGTRDASLSKSILGYKGYGYSELKSGNVVEVKLNIPGGNQLNGSYVIVVRYRSNTESTGDLTIESTGSLGITFPACADKWCYVNTQASRTYNLQSGLKTATLSITGSNILLDQIVAVPSEFISPTSTLVHTAFATDCKVLENDISANTDLCKKSIYSMSTYYLNGALACDCHATSILENSECSPYGGQCVCKSNIGGRKCDECVPEFYDHPNGCKACECKGVNKVCDKGTGKCSCPPNTAGRACSECSLYHWNWTQVEGCKPCGCNAIGSISKDCNLTTGVCPCKVGVQGEKCTECKDGYKDFGVSGCSLCGCSTVGSNNTVCNKTSGQCSCKTNVDGTLCDKCSATSFYLSSSNPKGCLDCICMGITKTCSSSTETLLRIFTLLTSNRGGVLKSNVQLGNSRGGVINRNVSIVTNTATYLSVQIPEGASEFWLAPDDLKGNLINRYGSTIDLEVMYSGAGTAISPQAVIVAKNQSYTHTLKESITAGSKTSITIPLSESDWVKEGSSTALTRSEFILVLNNVDFILLPAKFMTGDHTSILYRMVYSKPGIGSMNPSVEKCVCGKGYTGSSCERCAPGYKRVNASGHDFLGECVPCVCNNHASSCDPDTGECIDCKHQTTGANCEICKMGYYGDATLGTANDCLQCSCFKPRVGNESCVKESGVEKCLYCNTGYKGNLCDECDTFYFGNPKILNTGTCERCNCNGNSDSCDSEGKCISCKNNTIGDNCEKCKDGFFGNATAQNCSVCACNEEGRLSATCDPNSGQCQCKPGVGSRKCDSCMPNYWGFNNKTFTGCKPCMCTEAGSKTLQCNDVSGKCECNANTSGDKCDTCNDGFFGLPSQSCEACNCNGTGTDGGSDKCDKVGGQCKCKTGVSGRGCDQCMKFYTGFSANGCTGCGACESALGNDTLKQLERYEELWNNTQKVSAIQEKDVLLQSLQTQLNTTFTKLGLTENDFSSFNNVTDNFEKLTNESKSEVNSLMSKVASLQSDSLTYQNDTNKTNEKMLGLVTQSTLVYNNATVVKQTASNYELTLTKYNTTAYEKIGQGSVTTEGISLNFDKELQMAQKSLTQIQDESGVKSMQSKVADQAGFINSLDKQLTDVDTNIKDGLKTVLDTEEKLAGLLLMEKDVQTNQKSAMTYKTQAEELLNETKTLISKAENQTTEGESSLQGGKTSITKYDAIYNGAASEAMPADMLKPELIAKGYGNYTDGKATLRTALDQAKAGHVAFKGLITAAESKAGQLMNEAVELNTTFSTVKGRGDKAVEAIQSYEKVQPVLESAYNLSVSANTTIQEIRSTLAKVSIPDLERLANLSKTESENLRTEYQALNYQDEVLNVKIESANASMQQAVNDWKKVEKLIEQMTNDSTALKDLASKNTISTLMAEGTQIVAQTDQKIADQTTLSNNRINNLNLRESEITTLKNLSSTGSQLVTETEQSLNNHNSRVAGIKAQLDLVKGLQADTASLDKSLEDTFKSIEEKIKQAEAKLKDLKQPIRFNGSSPISVTNQVSNNVDTMYNDISLEFRKETGVTDGLIFFAEDSAAGSELAIELVNGKMTFDFNTNLDKVSISNPAVICDGCWARVLASRYGNMGHLTVTIVSTGGRATTYGKGISSSDKLKINSPLMFGGVPTTYQTSKVKSRGFTGCLQATYFDTQSINLWNEAITLGWEPSCCRQSLQQTSSDLQPGISIDGSGFLVFKPTDLNLATRSSLYLTIKFRTYNPSGYIVLVTNDGQPLKYAIYLDGGFVNFQYGTTTIKSQQKYNIGKWVEVNAEYRPTEIKLETKIVGQTPVTPDIQTLASAQVNFTVLANKDLIIGAKMHPNSASYVRSVNNFAGSLKDLKYGNNVDTLKEFSLTSNPVKSQGVTTKGVYETVINGMRFTTLKSYVELSSGTELSNIQTIEFQLITESPKGVLVYAQETSAARKLYISLFHGNIVVKHIENDVTKFTIASSNLYLSDGKEHKIKLEISTKPKLTIDDVMVESTDSITLPVGLTGVTQLYAGGVPSSLSLPAELPAKQAIVGAIRNLKVNQLVINPFTSGVIVKQEGLDLSGIKTPSDFTPPLPYLTTPAPTTVAPPTCAPLTSPVLMDASAGVWFNGKENENIDFALKSVPFDSFKSSFLLSITFQSFSPSGILYYVSDSNTNQKEWYMIYLNNGYLQVSLQSTNETDGGLLKYDFQSSERYNDGVKRKVDFLKINNFLAIVETTRKDYANNNITLTTPSVLKGNSKIFLGGVDQSIGREIPPIQSIKENVNFVGAIFDVTLEKSQLNYKFNLRNATRQDATSRIYANVAYGVTLSGVNSYIKLENPLKDEQLQFMIGFRTRQKSANLFTIYESSGSFVVLDLLDGKIRVLIASPSSSGQSFISVNKDQINICDYKQHNITVTLGANGVGIQTDSNINQVFAYPNGLTPPKLMNRPVYIGGLEDTSLTFPDTVSKESLKGCVEKVVLQKVEYDLTTTVKSSRGLSFSCPL